MEGSVVQNIEKSVEQRLTELDIELVDIEYCKENKEQIIRIYIDRESGVNLELCTVASRAIKDIIDDRNIYYDHMEVSSPGLDRVLKKEKDFVRFTGQRVKVMTLKKFDGPRKNIGILEEFSDNYLKLKSENEFIIIPRDMISVVKLHPDF